MGFQCKETKVTFCNIHMWVFGGKHERCIQRRHLVISKFGVTL